MSGTVTNNNNFTIGAGAAGAAAFTGNVDDVRVYDKELTAKEADRLHKMTQSDIDIIETKMHWKEIKNNQSG